jgi:hypothetical protein
MGKCPSKHKYPYHQHHLFGSRSSAIAVYALHQGPVAEYDDGIDARYHKCHRYGDFVKVTSDDASDQEE